MGQNTAPRKKPPQLQSTDLWQRNKGNLIKNSLFKKWLWNNWSSMCTLPYPNQKTPHRCYKFHKNYLKMDHDSLMVEHKTIKLLYQNTGEDLGDRGFGRV